MSFVVHFVPADAPVAPESTATADEPVELTDAELAGWDDVHRAVLAVLPADDYDLDATPFSRQMAQRDTGLQVSWQHGEYQASLPFWSANATSGAFDALVGVTEAIEAASGLVGVDEISGGRFLDHQQVADSFAAMAEGFEEAMEQQTLLGRLRSLFHRG